MSIFNGLSAFPITPADPAGIVDTSALTSVLKRLQEAAPDSIGLLGSTGAYAFLSRDQRRLAVDTAMAVVGGKVPVIVGVGALRTDEAKALASDARNAGADGMLLAPMSYTPLTEDEVYAHFAAVADAGRLPICIYNNPSTTRFTFSVDLIDRLARIPYIQAVKMPLPVDGNFTAEIHNLRQKTPSEFAVGYSGDWGAADGLLAGADAWYSVVAGLLPKEALALTRAAQAKDLERVRALSAAFDPLWSLFKEYGSFRVMYVIAAILGVGHFNPPLPVLGLDSEARNKIKKAVDTAAAVVR